MYLVTGEGDQTESTLMIAKSRVSPIKVVSLPKLELCGAQLLAQLISSILPQLSPQPTAIGGTSGQLTIQQTVQPEAMTQATVVKAERKLLA